MKTSHAEASAALVHDIELRLKKAGFLLRPFDFDGTASKQRMPTNEEIQRAWDLLQEAVIFIERGLRDQLANPIEVTLPEMGVPPTLRIVPTVPDN